MPGGGPFPGFSMDHFNYGYQQGQQPAAPQMPGMQQAPQPYDFGMQGTPGGPGDHMNDPNFHGALQQAISQTPGLAEAMQQDPALQQHIMQTVAQGPGALQGMQGGGQGLPQGGAPPQAGPQAQPGGHQSFKDYLNSPEGHDSAMMGLIFAQMGQNPDQALKMALQFKEQRDRRTWLAQQATQAQEATQENVKIRAEAQKDRDKDTKQRTLAYKIDSSRKDIAALGVTPPEMPDDPDAWPAYYEDLRNKLADAKKVDLDKKQLDKDRKQGFTEAFKTGSIPEKFKDDPMVQAAAQMAKDRNARAEERLDIQRTREDQLAKLRADKATLPNVSLQAQALNRVLNRNDKAISRYEQNIFRIHTNGIYPFMSADDPQRAEFDREIDSYQKRIDALEEKQSTLEESWDELVTTKGEKTPPGGPAPLNPTGTAIKDIVPQSAHAPTGAEAAKTYPTPSEKAIRNFKIKAQAEGLEAVTARWKAIYGPNAPIPSVD